MKKILLVLIIISFLIIITIFIKNNYKNEILGNNMSNQSIKDLEKYILNICSYKATAEVTINSNKNTNKYKLNQIYKDGKYYQEVIEPNSIKGMKIIYDGENLKLENTNLNLSKVYDNYKYISSNQLDLEYFIQDYKNSPDANLIDKEEELIMETTYKNEDRYLSKKMLYVDKKAKKPTRLEIKDNTQNTLVYILYSEIQINTLQEDSIFAFLVDKQNHKI